MEVNFYTPPQRRSKLNEEQKDEIIKLFDNNHPIKNIAEKFQVSRPTIYSVITARFASEIQRDRVRKEIFHRHIQSVGFQRKADNALKEANKLEEKMLTREG